MTTTTKHGLRQGLRELLERQHDGLLAFAGARAVVLDALALGLLRREIVSNIGVELAQVLLTRVGFDHGWHCAERLESGMDWASIDEWRHAYNLILQSQGMVRIDPNERPRINGEMRSRWYDSYEATQHGLHHGPSREPVCWTLTGFVSGYLSRAFETDIFCLETSCLGCGALRCEIVAKPRAMWDDDDQALIAARYEGAQFEALLPPHASGPLRLSTAGHSLAEVERAHILATLKANHGNRERSAEQLGISPATLYRRLREWRDQGLLDDS